MGRDGEDPVVPDLGRRKGIDVELDEVGPDELDAAPPDLAARAPSGRDGRGLIA